MNSELNKEVDDFLAKKSKSSRTMPLVIVVGLNKTGTASLRDALRELGLEEGNQHIGELLLEDYLAGKTDRILDLCETGDFFRDIPFSLPGLYEIVYERYPEARYILTVRDSPEQWYSSVMKFHSNLFANGLRLKKKHLKNAEFKYKGYLHMLHNIISGGNGVLKKTNYINFYNDHDKRVKQFFSDKQDQFLELNVKDPKAYLNLCAFLGLEPKRDRFPMVNKTRKKGRLKRLAVKLGI